MIKMDAVTQQTVTEYKYDKSRINKNIQKAIKEDSDLYALVLKGIDAVYNLIETKFEDNKKNKRLNKIEPDSIEHIVLTLCSTVFTESGSLSMANLMGRHKYLLGENLETGLDNLADIIIAMVDADVFDLELSMWNEAYIRPKLICDEEIFKYIKDTMYLPPMLVEPRKLYKNSDSPYLTRSNDSNILKEQWNYHNEDICLGVINNQNKVPFSLDLNFLSKIEEEATYLLDTKEKKEQFLKFKKDSYEVYKYLVANGNEFFIPIKADKRGRLYRQGYHVNTQSNSFRKASINFAQKEVIEGF